MEQLSEYDILTAFVAGASGVGAPLLWVIKTLFNEVKQKDEYVKELMGEFSQIYRESSSNWQKIFMELKQISDSNNRGDDSILSKINDLGRDVDRVINHLQDAINHIKNKR